ncbi:MAG: hypothetical protein Q9204_000167 [Flavoplaca sp. TL-2023a]
MAPTGKIAPKEHKRLDSTIAFATRLEKALRDASDNVPLLADALLEQIECIALVSSSALVDKIRDFDERGTRIWNLASKLKNDAESGATLAQGLRAIQLCQQAGIEVLSRCEQSSPPAFRPLPRLTITDQGQLSITERIVERAAAYEQRLRKGSHIEKDQDSEVRVRRMSAEYHVLRITLAWRQGRLDLAEIWLANMNLESRVLEPSVAEQLADTVYEIGRDQLTKGCYQWALQWLDRAHDILASQNPEELSADSSEVQSCIMHTTIRVLLKTRDEESISRAWNIYHELEGKTKNERMLSLLKLELLGADQSAVQDYYEALDGVVRQIHLSDINLTMILHHVHELRRRNARLAHAVLAVLLSERVLIMDQIAWVERTLVTIIWNCTTSPGLSTMTDTLEELLDTIVVKTDTALSTSATHAAQILMLKLIEALYSQADFDQADVWCRLALHNVFSGSGTSNAGKLQRKRILCAIGNSDLAKCQEVRCQMSDSIERDPSTQYLLYKAALRCQDAALAAECLELISNQQGNDSNLLYACVLEAQKNGDRVQVIRALTQVLEKTSYQTIAGLHLPALLRLTARMLIQELESEQRYKQHCVEELCKVFEGAAAAAKRLRRDPSKDDTFPCAELDWFSRNSYNLALKMCTVWRADATLRIVQVCSNVNKTAGQVKRTPKANSLKFIDLYPLDNSAEQYSDLSLRRLFCDFLGCCLLITLARGEDTIEDQLRYYLTLRKTMSNFRTLVKQQLPKLEGGAKSDLMRKYSCLIAFDFEAAARLKAWASLEDLIKESESCGDEKVYNIMADITLASEAPTETVMIGTLQQIVNRVWSRDSNNVERLARWIRCLLSLALTSNVEMAEHLIDQVISIARTAQEKITRYPMVELEWVATTAFNRAVDFYCTSQDAICRRWAEKAMSLADLNDDNGRLHRLLQEKYVGLTWDR